MTIDRKFAGLITRYPQITQIDYEKARKAAIALWQRMHPEAMQERSIALHPLILLSEDKDELGHVQHWVNDVYSITRREFPDRVFMTNQGIIHLGISSFDGTARHDWRDFQAIKNQLVGPECEAFELYPAESRLLDTSNYYSLWCFPGLKRIRVGEDHRDVRTPDEAFAPQRGFGKAI